MARKEQAAFVKAYNDIDVRCLTDDELIRYAALCKIGLIKANEEYCKRIKT